MRRRPFLIFLLALNMGFVISCAGVNAPGFYKPNSGKGHVVLMISGSSGTAFYEEFAARLADSGYYVLLYDGNDFPLAKPAACQTKIKEILTGALRSPYARAGKAAVIGYSLGGAVALTCAAGMKEDIAGIITYYPGTMFIKDQDSCVDNFAVPITVLQGKADRYFNCCNVEKITDMSAAARQKGKTFELIVYPAAGHGFNLGVAKNSELDKASWQKTMETLRTYRP